MTRILECALVIALLGAATAFCQQPQQNPPPPGAPGTNPDRTAPPSSSAPPSGASQDKAQNNAQMESDIRDVFSSDPALQGTDVRASVDDVNITLTGTVQSQAQVERVMALVSPFARYRSIVNKVTIK